MINEPTAELDDVTQERVSAILISFQLLVRRRHGVNPEARRGRELPGIQTAGQLGDYFQPVNDELAIRLRNNQVHFRIRAQKGAQGLGIEMVRVIVARGDAIDKIQSLRRHHALGHAHVRLVSGRVFFRQRIGQIRIEEELLALPLQQKTALAEPPEVEMLEVLARGRHIGNKGAVP